MYYIVFYFHLFQLKESGLSSLSISPKDTHIASGNKNGNLYLLSVSNNLISKPISIFPDKVSDLFMSYFISF